MTKEERRAEKIRMLVQSGQMFLDAGRALQRAQDDARTVRVSAEDALWCVFVAHLSNEVQSIRRELAQQLGAPEALSDLEDSK